MSKALREAAQQALEALDSALGAVDGHYYDAVVPSANIAADALRTALAESERDWSLLEATQESLREHMAEIQRLRAALAQPAASGVPLTDEQINEIAECAGHDRFTFAAAIEAAHGIIEQGGAVTDLDREEPNMRHPKIQALIGDIAELQIVEQLLDDGPDCELTSMDMEYWNGLHDKLRDRLIAPSEKPVAWLYQTKSGFRKCWHTGEQNYPQFIADKAAASEFPDAHSWTPLYSRPRPAYSGKSVSEIVATELERLAQDPPISGNTLAQARVLMTAANVREFGLDGGAAVKPAQQPLTDDQVSDLARTMNEELIDQIAFQSGCDKHWYNDPNNPDLCGRIISREVLDKFAQLIVKECANIIDYYYRNGMGDVIKEKFGVEEYEEDSACPLCGEDGGTTCGMPGCQY